MRPLTDEVHAACVLPTDAATSERHYCTGDSQFVSSLHAFENQCCGRNFDMQEQLARPASSGPARRMHVYIPDCRSSRLSVHRGRTPASTNQLFVNTLRAVPYSSSNIAVSNMLCAS